MDRDFTNRASIILDEVLVQQQQMKALTGNSRSLTNGYRATQQKQTPMRSPP
ncbi:MAG: hypothetical protein WBV73_20775 [Phormidium sp.]